MLARIDAIDADIADLDARIEEQITPFVHAEELLVEIPGIGERAAQVVISELGRRGALLRPAPSDGHGADAPLVGG